VDEFVSLRFELIKLILSPKNVYMVDLGKPIKKSEGDQMFQTFKGIKLRTQSSIRAILSQDAEASRFFTETDLAFVFDKSSLTTLYQRLINDNDCIILFNGSRYDEVAGKLGRPTLCAFAYTVSYNQQGHRIGTVDLGGSTDTDDGYEHPGNYSIRIDGSGIPTTIDLDADVVNIQ
jgi:hypothetical protein